MYTWTSWDHHSTVGSSLIHFHRWETGLRYILNEISEGAEGARGHWMVGWERKWCESYATALTVTKSNSTPMEDFMLVYPLKSPFNQNQVSNLINMSTGCFWNIMGRVSSQYHDCIFTPGNKCVSHNKQLIFSSLTTLTTVLSPFSGPS